MVAFGLKVHDIDVAMVVNKRVALNPFRFILFYPTRTKLKC